MKKFLPKTLKNPKGFTLIELLVVISIIAILSVIGITIFSSVQKGARDTKRRGDLQAISKALELYKSANGRYPGVNSTWYLSSGSTAWIPGLEGQYMISMPKDPMDNSIPPYANPPGFSYGYHYYGDEWMLVAHMESPSATDLKTKCSFAGGAAGVYGSTNSGAASDIYEDAFMVCNQQ